MRSVAAILSGAAASVAAAIPVAWISGGLHPWSAWILLGIGGGVAALVFSLMPRIPLDSPNGFWGWAMIAIFALASFRAFFWLIYRVGDEWKILSPNNLGDLSLHLSLIRWLAFTPHWWPASPILTGDPLRYPPGSDLFNALLLRAGLPAEQGLLWTGLAGAVLAGVSLWRWGGAVALAAFLFNGGFAGCIFWQTGWSGDPEATTQWKNLFLTLFVTQRGFLFALPAGLLLLSSWRREFFDPSRRPLLPLPVAALLLAVTPLFSVHTALFLGTLMTGLFLLVPEARKSLLRLALFGWPFMVLFGWLVTSGAGGPSAVGGIGWKPGWMSDGTPGYWFWNFGAALPLALMLCGILFRRGGAPEARAFVWPSAFVFALCLLVRFAPWPWDNTKLMLWSWLTVIPFLWRLLLANRPLLLRSVASVLLFGSGALTLVAGLDGRHGYDLVGQEELDMAASVLRDVPPDGVIACAPEYNHPILMLGHPVVCGYEGHLWSHGLDYHTRWDRLDTVMKGEPGWRDGARSLGIRAIYWGPLEAKRWPDSKLPWAKESTPSLHPL